MRTSSCLLGLTVLVLPVAASAQMGTSKPGMQAVAAFKGLDRNGDGGLTRGELLSHGREKAGGTAFALLDADGDGRLSLKEFTGVPTGALIGRFDAYDSDRNGFVSRKEFPVRLDPMLFDALDRDHDGRVSLAEFRPAFGGTRVKAEAAPPPRKPAQARPAPPTTACWVTGFGDNKWMLEAPVTWGRCRIG